MDYSAANTWLWNGVIQLGLIAGALVAANCLRNKITAVRKSLMPVAVLAGFLLLLLKYTGLVSIDTSFMELLVYHGIALGFIAMSLRVMGMEKNRRGSAVGFKSGAVIISTYLVQGVTGLLISLVLSYTLLPGLFKASGLLLPMGYGQGPGQANNVGTSYEALGFAGGRSFGLSLAAAGYICACVVGVVMLNILARRGKLGKSAGHTHAEPPVSFFQDKDEIPVADSVDKLSIQIAMILIVYLISFLAAWGVTAALSAAAPSLADTVNPLIWGFNFLIGSAVALLTRSVLEWCRKRNIIRRQYQNNYLLNRLSGFLFDLMIVAGIASINVEDLSGLWAPFILMAAAGGLVTWLHLGVVCKAVYGDYYYEGLLSMYGMLTGTISSGVLLLREIDPDLTTPAANNLIVGSSFGILLGAPVLLLVGLAARSDMMCWLTVALALIYLAVLLFVIYKVKGKVKE